MEVDNNPVIQTDEFVQIMDLLKTQKILQKQLLEINISTLLNSASSDDSLFDGDNGEQELNKKLLTATSMLCMKELALKKLLLSFTLQQLLCSPTNTQQLSKIENISYIHSLLENQTHLTNNILKCHKEIQDLTEEKYQLEKSCQDLKKTKNFLMDKLTKGYLDKDSVTESDDCKRSKEVLKGFIARIQILQFTFQNIIHGSGVHWQKDKKLLEIIRNFGMDLPF